MCRVHTRTSPHMKYSTTTSQYAAHWLRPASPARNGRLTLGRVTSAFALGVDSRLPARAQRPLPCRAAPARGVVVVVAQASQASGRVVPHLVRGFLAEAAARRWRTEAARRSSASAVDVQSRQGSVTLMP